MPQRGVWIVSPSASVGSSVRGWTLFEAHRRAAHLEADAVVGEGPVGGSRCVLVRPGSVRRLPRSSRGATSTTVAMVPVGGRSGWRAVRGGAGSRCGRRVDGPRARRAGVRARSVGHGGRGRRDDGDYRPPGARERAVLPADPGAPDAVAARRNDRHERGRSARLQVRRHWRLGDPLERSWRPASS